MMTATSLVGSEMVRCLRIALAIIVVLSISPVSGDDAVDHRAKIIARQKALENVTVRYRRSDRFHPRADSPKVRQLPGGGKLVLKTEPEDYQGEFRYFRDRAGYSKERIGDVPQGDWRRTISVVSADFQESLIERDDISGIIDRKVRQPSLEYIDIALGLRAFGSHDWLSAETLGQAEVDIHDDGRVSLRWLDGARVEHVYYFDPEPGYALVSYTRSRRGVILSTIDNFEFERIDNLFLPFQSVYTEYRTNEGRSAPSRRVTIDVDEYKLGDSRNATDDFRIEWPFESSVTDVRAGVSVRVMSRPHKLDDEMPLKAAKAQK